MFSNLTRAEGRSKWRFTGGAIGLVAHEAMSRLSACEDWTDISSALGPRVTAPTNGDELLVGMRASGPVAAMLEDVWSETWDPHKSRRVRRFLAFAVSVVAAIAPPLRIGLCIAPSNAAAGTTLSLPDVTTGNGPLDAAYRIASADPERAATFVRDLRGDGWDIADALLELSRAGLNVEMTDTSVRIYQQREDAPEARELAFWVERAAWIAQMASHARRSMPPARYELGYSAALESAATELGFKADDSALSMTGHVDGIAVGVHMGSKRGGLYTVVTSSIPAPIAHGLRIDRATSTTGWTLSDIFGGAPQDILVAVGALDAAFRIQGYPEVNVRWAVRAVGQLLLDVLARSAAIQVSGNTVRITLHALEMHAPYLVQVVRDAVGLARGLSATPPAPVGSPYR